MESSMSINFIPLAIYVLCFVQTCAWRSEGREPQISKVQQDVSIQGVPQEKAIAIAKEHALISHKSLERFRVVPCELSIFWRIIFDGGGPEYVIDKKTGLIRRVQTIQEDWTDQRGEGSEVRRATTREEAIEIAKRDTIESIPGTDMNHFTITACELQKVWRVFVEFKLRLEPGSHDPILPHSSAPNYVIDKKTGKILFKQRYGSVKH